MISASKAIVTTKNFGPKKKEKNGEMPSIQNSNQKVSSSKKYTIRLGAGPQWCS